MGQGFNLDLDKAGRRRDELGALQHGRDAASGCDVVFLDQHRVIEADAVVGAAAGAHRIFLRQTQTRQRLARVDNLRPVVGHALNGLNIVGGFRGDGAEQLQEVEGGALGGQQRARRAFNFQHHLIGRAGLAFGHAPGQAHVRIELLQRGLGPGRATDHGGFARQHLGPGTAIRVNQTRGEVARAHVLLQGPRRIRLSQSSHGRMRKIK